MKNYAKKISIIVLIAIVINLILSSLSLFVQAAEITDIDGIPYINAIIEKNYTKEGEIEPRYIIIHDTGNRGKGANAMANRNYFNTTTREASAQYLVDDTQIVQAVPDNKKAWHIGDGKQQTEASNNNSIGIELCVNEDGNFGQTYQHGIVLTKYLMKKYNIPAENVIRHYDATKKICPRIMIEDDPSLWTRFKEEISKNDEEKIEIDNSQNDENPDNTSIEINEQSKATSNYLGTINPNGRVVGKDALIKLLPSNEVDDVDIIYQGSLIEIIEQIGEKYCKIRYNNTEGYIPYENTILFSDFAYDKNGKVETSTNIIKKLTHILSFGMIK